VSVPRHFSALARRSSDPPISWLMKLALERPGLISLAVGFTDSDTLPVAEVAELTRDILARPKTARAALQYGTTAGLPQLRHALLRREVGAPTSLSGRPDDVIITNGSQQLLYLISEVLCDPGDIVLVEDPTYFVYLGIVEALGIRAAGFSSIENLKSKIENLKSRRLLSRLKLLYLVTYFQNPTGRTWSLEEKREGLAVVKHYERAAGHRIYILEDAAYRDLRFEGEDVPSFKSLDPRNDRVAYTNTLTKPFATGMRLGYGILPTPLMRAVLRSKGNHDFGSSNFLQSIVARVLAEGVYDRHLPQIAAAYRRKRDVMVEELNKVGQASCLSPRGGLYIWVQLVPPIHTGLRSRFFRRALDAGVLYVPGELCFCRDPSRRAPQNTLRLSFGAPSAEQIRRGIRMLAQALALLLLFLGGCGKPNDGASNSKGWTVLHSAVDAGNAEQTGSLLRNRPGLVQADDGDGHTPLHVAADRGHREVAALLVDAGAKIDAPDSCGWTPLHTAAANGRVATAELLIARGANFNATDGQKQTPLRLAVKWRHPDVAELIRARGGRE